MTAVVLAALVAAAVSFAAQPFVIRLLTRLDVIDVPNHRSSHEIRVPRGGFGIAIGLVAGVVVYSLLPAAWSVQQGGTNSSLVALGTAAALALLFVVGFADDLLALPALPRLVAQALAGVALAASLGLPVWALAVVVVWVVALTNAANFMDGINGISGATAIVAGTYYAGAGLMHGDLVLAVVGAVLAGAHAGFLPFNVPIARLFMGDSGSYLLGGALAVCSVLAWRIGAPVLVAVAPLLPYLADTGSTLARRTLRRAHLLSGHREHTYQRLADVFGSHLAATSVAAVAAIACTYSILLPSAWSWSLVVVVIAGYLALPRLWPRFTSGSWHQVSSMSGGSR